MARDPFRLTARTFFFLLAGLTALSWPGGAPLPSAAPAHARAETGAPPDSGIAPGTPAGESAGVPRVRFLIVEDIIGPISARYIRDAIAAAEADRVDVFVLELDTPGGLIDSMRDIIKAILASEVPICVYVAPEGARAASAGAFITIAAHVAAMAPGTHIGAASPVSTGGAMDSTLASKAFHDAEAQMRSLAQLRGRNEEWAASAVTEAEAVPARDAVAARVVDFLAADRTELLALMDGRTVPVAGDTAHVIRSAGATIEEAEVSWRFRVLSLLNNPTIAYLLLMLGFYGIFFELSNPGAVFPAVVGGICLILGLLGLQTLSLNYAGLLLLVVGIVFFFLETQVTSHGLFTLGGVVALLAGSLMLFESPFPFLRVSLKVILPTVLVSAAFFAFAVVMALRAQRRKVVSGAEGLVGMRGETRTELNPAGTIFVAGEHWTAVSEGGEPIPAGATVEILSVEHLRLRVRRSTLP